MAMDGVGVLGAAGLVRVGRVADPHRGLRTTDELVPDVRAGRLRRVRRGAYVPAAVWDGSTADERYRVRALAVSAAGEGRVVLSHWSAAAIHGLPLVGRRDDRVHVVRGPATGGRSEGDVVRHTVGGAVPHTLVGGVQVTTVARTVVDLARLVGVVAAVAAGDHALREGVTTRAEVAHEVAAVRPGARGVRAARRALALVDARSESPGESLSRVRMDETGIPAPVLQHVVRDARGDVGRVDFWWPEHGVVGEFDGRVKYRLAGLTGGTAEEVLWREKLREDRLRATGLRVVRWTWQDAWDCDPLVRLLHAAGVH